MPTAAGNLSRPATRYVGGDQAEPAEACSAALATREEVREHPVAGAVVALPGGLDELEFPVG